MHVIQVRLVLFLAPSPPVLWPGENLCCVICANTPLPWTGLTYEDRGKARGIIFICYWPLFLHLCAKITSCNMSLQRSTDTHCSKDAEKSFAQNLTCITPKSQGYIVQICGPMCQTVTGWTRWNFVCPWGNMWLNKESSSQKKGGWLIFILCCLNCKGFLVEALMTPCSSSWPTLRSGSKSDLI